MRIATIVGARPQFVKAAALSVELRRRHEEILVHTGQHYDDNMSAVFFRELNLPPVDHHLNVGPGTHGAQTGRMLERIEQALVEIRPDAVIVFGDTDSTLAGALAAAKLAVPVAHVESGLRTYVRSMPEEINRVTTDHLSAWLFAPSAKAVEQLAAEGIRRGVFEVGDIMADCLRIFGPLARERSQVVSRLGFRQAEYAVATLHRSENIGCHTRLERLLATLHRLPLPVVLPLHPHTAARAREYGLEQYLRDGSVESKGRLICTEPLGYLDMIELERNAAVVLTDSGGLQKEAYYLGVPCVTLREETEWIETVEAGWNRLAGTAPDSIAAAVEACLQSRPAQRAPLYGDGRTAARISETLCRGLPGNALLRTCD